jgi:hypothetical protein
VTIEGETHMPATLVSPGVSVSVDNQSYYIPAAATTVPVFFIATKSGKKQIDNITPAAGTLEYGVVRTVTSRAQALTLYGIPSFRSDISGNQYHGDARNEYGLLALHQFLEVADRAYVIRANVDLTDEPVSFISLGLPVEQPGSRVYNGLGTGTLGVVTTTSTQVRPQTITVTFTSPTTYSVSGTLSGYVGTGAVNTPFTSTVVGFTVTAGATSFAIGDKFTFALVYAGTATPGNTGNGLLTGLVADTLAVPETFTITFTSPTAFTVDGTVSGPAGTGVLGSPFDNNRLNFIAINGTTPFAVGDSFTVTVSTVTITSPLGANDAAKRLAIVTALQAEINSNTEIRSPLYEFNLITCPGYHEVVDEMLSLSVAVKEEALVIADVPGDKTPEQAAQWGLTSARQVNTNVAYYYPWCLLSNLDGTNVLGAPSGTALRTIAYSDNVAYIWEAPAGVTRGVVTGVSQVGYFTGTAGTATTFIESNLGDGQRDNLYEYDKNINPIVFFPGRGILVWGQKTSAPAASALDRINVMRLVMYLRRALRKGALPFVFEPNDQITRDNLKAAADAVMHDILVKRGLTDYASYCDTSNNTDDRIDRNELWLDVAIKPTRAAEFIYIPIHVVGTSATI